MVLYMKQPIDAMERTDRSSPPKAMGKKRRRIGRGDSNIPAIVEIEDDETKGTFSGAENNGCNEEDDETEFGYRELDDDDLPLSYYEVKAESTIWVRAIRGNKGPSHGKAMESYFMYSSEDTNVRKSLPNAGHARERGFENTILRHSPVAPQKEQAEMSIDVSQDGALESGTFAAIS